MVRSKAEGDLPKGQAQFAALQSRSPMLWEVLYLDASVGKVSLRIFVTQGYASCDLLKALSPIAKCCLCP